MSSSFSKEEKVAFDNMLEGFSDALVLSKRVSVFRGGGGDAQEERTNDVIWRPQPYIMVSRDGRDQTGNFNGVTQMSVPSTVGYEKSVPWSMSATELRDALQEGRLRDSATLRLASDINVALMNVAANYGSLFVKRSSAASGYDDVAAAEALMNEQGITMDNRTHGFSTRDYNNMASNLAGRQTMQGRPETAYDASYVGRVAGFETFKFDYANRKAAALGSSITMDTRASAGNYYTPVATRVAATGEMSNVDNRFQTITVNSTTNVAAGDAFTIAGIDSVHHITKGDTGQLKTFRVVSVPDSTHLVITPPIISNQGGSNAEAMYQNCTAVSTASNAALTWLNTVAGYMNPFWHGDAIELRPSRYAIPTDAGAAVMKASTDQGIEVALIKWFNNKTLMTEFRADVRFGAYMLNTEMAGLTMFSQT